MVVSGNKDVLTTCSLTSNDMFLMKATKSKSTIKLTTVMSEVIVFKKVAKGRANLKAILLADV